MRALELGTDEDKARCIRTLWRAASRYHYASKQDANPVVAARHNGYAVALADALFDIASEDEVRRVTGESIAKMRRDILDFQDKIEASTLKAFSELRKKGVRIDLPGAGLSGAECDLSRGLLIANASFEVGGMVITGKKVAIDTGCEGFIAIDKSFATAMGLPLTLAADSWGVGGKISTWKTKLSRLSLDIAGCTVEDVEASVVDLPTPIGAYGAVALLGLDFLPATKMIADFSRGGGAYADVSCGGGPSVQVPIVKLFSYEDSPSISVSIPEWTGPAIIVGAAALLAIIIAIAG